MDLHDLLEDTVSGIQPTDRLEAIQARVAEGDHGARRWWYAAGGVVLATAAAVTVVAVVTGSGPAGDPDGHHDHHVASDPSRPEQVVGVYFYGPDGGRLVREFDSVPGGDPLQAALDRMQRPPSDPDYLTVWPTGSFGDVTVSDGAFEVEVDGARTRTKVHAVQQVVYTLQAAAGEQLPVQFVEDGEPVGGRFHARAENDLLYPVNISDPAEGTAYVETATFLARGVANSFEATVPWELQAEDGTVVKEGFATADGWMDKLYPWEAEVDIDGLPSGFYTFVAMTSDPSGGAEGNGPEADTRTIIVR